MAKGKKTELERQLFLARNARLSQAQRHASALQDFIQSLRDKDKSFPDKILNPDFKIARELAAKIPECIYNAVAYDNSLRTSFEVRAGGSKGMNDEDVHEFLAELDEKSNTEETT